MSIRHALPENPPHPGGILRREFLEPLGLPQLELARRLDIPFQRVNSLINGKRGVTPETAILFAKFFGNSPDFWLSMQTAYDLAHTTVDTSHIKPFKAKAS